jgi:AraC-like DNA-binding protein
MNLKMFILRDVLPSPMLREYVQRHKIIRFTFEANAHIPFKAYYPRPEHCLIFYLRDLGRISYTSNQKIITDPKCSISGQATGIINRYVSHDFWALQIVFQPSALFRLTGIPSYELTNTFIDAEAIWGKEIRTAHEQMSNTDDVDEAIKTAEAFLEKMVLKSKRNLLCIDKISQLILCQNKPISIENLASEACLSIRQFNRKFNERTGINPKTFDRIVRFNNAFRIKNAQPDLDWLSIAIACGYYDYNHLAKDYKEFTNRTPTGLFETDAKAPERLFGVVEIN